MTHPSPEGSGFHQSGEGCMVVGKRSAPARCERPGRGHYLRGGGDG